MDRDSAEHLGQVDHRSLWPGYTIIHHVSVPAFTSTQGRSAPNGLRRRLIQWSPGFWRKKMQWFIVSVDVRCRCYYTIYLFTTLPPVKFNPPELHGNSAMLQLHFHYSGFLALNIGSLYTHFNTLITINAFTNTFLLGLVRGSNAIFTPARAFLRQFC